MNSFTIYNFVIKQPDMFITQESETFSHALSHFSIPSMKRTRAAGRFAVLYKRKAEAKLMNPLPLHNFVNKQTDMFVNFLFIVYNAREGSFLSHSFLYLNSVNEENKSTRQMCSIVNEESRC